VYQKGPEVARAELWKFHLELGARDSLWRLGGRGCRGGSGARTRTGSHRVSVAPSLPVASRQLPVAQLASCQWRPLGQFEFRTYDQLAPARTLRPGPEGEEEEEEEEEEAG